MNDGVYFVIKISRIKTTCLFVPYINNSEALLVYREASWPHIQCRDTTRAAQWQQATVGVAAAANVCIPCWPPTQRRVDRRSLHRPVLLGHRAIISCAPASAAGLLALRLKRCCKPMSDWPITDQWSLSQCGHYIDVSISSSTWQPGTAFPPYTHFFAISALPSRTITRTVSTEQIGFRFSYFPVFGPVR